MSGTCIDGTCVFNAPLCSTSGACATDQICHDGTCIPLRFCSDGNECTDEYLLPDGECFATPTNAPRPCTFGMHDGVCIGSVCSCDSRDDCDDGNANTADECWDFFCWHSQT
jgi:hypothetical protein